MTGLDLTHGTLSTWFRESATRHADAVAIEFEDREITYRELLDLAERVATLIVGDLLRRPSAVGVLAAHSLEGFAGYLAAVLLGATVVPLNPAFPPERTRLMCRAAGVEVLVADAGSAGQVAELLRDTTITPVILSDVDKRLDLPARYRRPSPARPDDVAYALFTSGSTGTPKGVPIRHRCLGPYLTHCVAAYETGPGSRLSHNFSLTFDISVYDMFVTWCSGATLVVPGADDSLTPVRFVTERRITHWFSVPSVISIARRLRTLRPGSMPSLRYSLFGGETLTTTQAHLWAAAAPNSAIVNIYGPTETTVSCFDYRLPADPGSWPETSNATVPLGVTYPHMESVVLDEQGRAAEEGELCLRGVQRFDGYLDPADDKDRFVEYDGGTATPWTGTPTDKHWYRSGDRVRREDGRWVHLGRLDGQIKLRGYRVELGEIESVLRRHEDVHDAVVLAVPGESGEPELHALYTGNPADPGELGTALGHRLPDYMVPWQFHHRVQFPLNDNGKIDRRRLREELTAPIGS